MYAEGGRRGGWGVIVSYALVCAGTQVLWLTYAAIDTNTAHHYGVSVSTVGWLSEIFPLLYVVLRSGRAPARSLVSTGAGRRRGADGRRRCSAVGGDTFAWAMAGQVTVAVAQPVILSAVSKLAGDYLPAAERPAGIAVGSAGGFVGMLLALSWGRPWAVTARSNVYSWSRRRSASRRRSDWRWRCELGVGKPTRARRSREAQHRRFGNCRRCAPFVAWSLLVLASSSPWPPG